jgi:hypothetical protein
MDDPATPLNAWLESVKDYAIFLLEPRESPTMPSIRTTCGLFVAVSAALATPGCGGGGGDNLPRQEVSGTVTLNGQPLADGTIQLMPMSQEQGTLAGGEVKDGKFSIDRTAGPVPGGYKVMIFSAGGAAPASTGEMPGQAPPPPKELIPPQYNSASTLNVEVKAEGPNTFDFPLKK